MYSIHKLEPLDYSELHKISALFKICFQTPLEPNFFKWKYLDNPTGNAQCYAVKNDKDIIGVCAMIPEEFFFLNIRKKIYKCCDLMVHPDFQKKGIARNLIFYATDDLKNSTPLLYTLCGKSSRPIFAKNNWLKLANFVSFFKHRLQLRAEVLILDRFDHLPAGCYVKPIRTTTELFENFPENYPLSNHDTPFHIVKDEKYLNWRLSDPRYSYSILGYYESKVLKGYAVYNSETHKMTHLMDVEAIHNDSTVINTLIRSIEKIAAKQNNSVVALSLENGFFQKYLKRNRYIYNLFTKGPLCSLDFRTTIFDADNYEISSKANWEIGSLHYDDV